MIPASGDDACRPGCIELALGALCALALLAQGCGGDGSATDATAGSSPNDGSGDITQGLDSDGRDAADEADVAVGSPFDSGPAEAGGVDAPAKDAAASGDAVEAGGAGGSTPFQPVGCSETRVLAQSTNRPLGVFPIPEGILIVWGDLIQLVGRDGVERKNVRLSRPATAAAFDGEWLAVADGAAVSSFGPGLDARGTILLKEPCESAVMLSAQRFVCAPATDSDRIYYTYDLVQGALVASSSRYTYSGRRMFRVGDADAFVTVTSGSPSDFIVFEVSPLGRATKISDSPYHGDFEVNDVLAFTGGPDWHLVTSQGLMLQVFPSTCKRGNPSGLTSNCLVRNGVLGTLRARERYVALANDAGGKLVAMVTRSPMPPQFGPPPATSFCGEGCRAQLIDPATRAVVGEWSHALPIKSIVTTAADSTCNMTVLGYEQDAAAGGGYRVALLEHGGPAPAPAVPVPPALDEDACAVGKVLRQPGTAIAAFPGRAGVLVVMEDELLRVSRKGNVLHRRPWPRPINRAVMDGDRLVVFDPAVMTVMDANFVTTGFVPLAESCPQAQLVSGGRVVCSPGGNGFRNSIYTYDLAGPKLLARSESTFYATEGMKAIPGRPWLINREQLLEVADDGAVRSRQSYSVFEVSQPAAPVASAGNPASLIVDSRANVFRPNPSCMPRCLERIGMWSAAYGGFLSGLTDGPEGTVFLTSNYSVTQVDAMTGMVRSRGPNLTNQGSLVSAVHDDRCKAMTLLVKGSDANVVEQAAYEGGQAP